MNKLKENEYNLGAVIYKVNSIIAVLNSILDELPDLSEINKKLANISLNNGNKTSATDNKTTDIKQVEVVKEVKKEIPEEAITKLRADLSRVLNEFAENVNLNFDAIYKEIDQLKANNGK